MDYRNTLSAVLGLFLFSPWAHATWINPVGGGGAESSLQQVLNNRIDPAYQPDASGSPNSAIGNDAYWAIAGGSSGEGAATIVIELAGFANQNSFGIYGPQGSDSTKITVFTGSDGANTKKTISIDAAGDVFINSVKEGNVGPSGVFGFYLSTPQGRTYYSDNALNQQKNPGDLYANGYEQIGNDAKGQPVDHLVAFQGKSGGTINAGDSKRWEANDYILAWEDLYGGGDRDYQDMVLLVQNIRPVPEAASTLVLLGATLLGITVLQRRRS